jgi:hypothetical protein
MAENRGRGAEAHREGNDPAAPVDSPLESQAGGGRVANARGEAVDEEGEVAPGGGYRREGVELGGYSTGNFNHASRQGRIDSGAADDGRHPHWWNHGHHGGFYLYRGGGVREGTDQGRSTFRGESEEATGMDYQTDGASTADDQPR